MGTRTIPRVVHVQQISEREGRRLSLAEPFKTSLARLDSAQTSSPHTRWSYLPAHPTRILQHDPVTNVTTLRTPAGVERRWNDPLEALATLQPKRRPIVGPPFQSGWIGYLSYDLGRLFESVPSRAVDDLRLPLFAFTYHHRVLAFDHRDKLVYHCRDSEEPTEPVHFSAGYGVSAAPPEIDVPRGAYEQVVGRALEYISAGDVFQVNLAQRFTAGLPMSPREVYEKLRKSHPAHFGAFLDYGTYALISNSPELFLRITPEGRVMTRPIKGTRPLLPGEDVALMSSEKDAAELNMIIDLERNDLGRICRTGSIKVTERRAIEAHPTLYHAAATVEGMLRPNTTLLEVLRATFPGGSITGAPKIRAMQIIDELEPTRRGPYCGAIGYFSDDGHAEFNIAIRTMIAQRDKIHFSVGAGIVADSTPAAEYEETLVKATAMMSALK